MDESDEVLFGDHLRRFNYRLHGELRLTSSPSVANSFGTMIRIWTAESVLSFFMNPGVIMETFLSDSLLPDGFSLCHDSLTELRH